MGADMIIAAVAIPKDTQPNYNAGREFLERYEITEEVVAELVNNGSLWDGDDEYFDEDDKPKVDKIREWLLTQHHDFEETINSRVATSLAVRDLWVYIVGGLSWGDAPEGCDAIWVMYAVPGLLTEMGFAENYHEVENPVTPEEEAAAVESIKRSVP